MDIFIEQLVEKRPETRTKLTKVVILGLAAALSALCMAAFLLTGQILALIVIPGVIWLAAHTSRNLYVEYEYILTNKELDIDKIIGRNKRKRMLTLNLTSAERFGVYGESVVFDTDTTVSAHDNRFTNMWYLVGKHKTHGNVAILFNPNADFVAKLNSALPAKARNKTAVRDSNHKEAENGSSTV
jgi:hypothetical protein